MPNNRNYFENIAKEINEAYQAGRRRNEMSQTSGPGTDEAANKLAGVARRAKGQLAGAVFMGARYNSKGKRIK
jgi:hypothetical protein